MTSKCDSARQSSQVSSKRKIESSHTAKMKKHRQRRAQEGISVMFSGIEPDAKDLAAIHRIGARLVRNVNDATHMICCGGGQHFKRTKSVLCAMSLCRHLLDIEWLAALTAGHAVDETISLYMMKQVSNSGTLIWVRAFTNVMRVARGCSNG